MGLMRSVRGLFVRSCGTRIKAPSLVVWLVPIVVPFDELVPVDLSLPEETRVVFYSDH